MKMAITQNVIIRSNELSHTTAYTKMSRGTDENGVRTCRTQPRYRYLKLVASPLRMWIFSVALFTSRRGRFESMNATLLNNGNEMQNKRSFGSLHSNGVWLDERLYSPSTGDAILHTNGCDASGRQQTSAWKQAQIAGNKRGHWVGQEHSV